MEEDEALLKTLEGQTIRKMWLDNRDDEIYLILDDDRLINIWALPTNQSGAVPLFREVTQKDLTKRVRRHLYETDALT